MIDRYKTNSICNAYRRMLQESVGFISYDEDYTDIEAVLAGLRGGKLLVHVRVHDETDFRYGIEPSAGEFLKSTDSWQSVSDEDGNGPELTFFGDDLKWSINDTLKDVRKSSGELDLIFVRKNSTIQKSLGDGRVELWDGKVVPYERSSVADYESEFYKGEPAGVERNDWYTRETQEVVAVIPRSLIQK